MFPESYKKFYAVLTLSLVLGLGAVAVSEGGSAMTGYATSEAVGGASSFSWPVFLFGLFVGACAVGLAIGIVYYERGRL